MSVLAKALFQVVSKFYNKLYWWAKIQIYKKDHRNKIYDITIDDFDYKLSFIEQPMTANIVQRIEGRREPQTVASYKSLVKPGMKVLELGACFGEFTILLSHLIGQHGKLVSVEGTPNIFKILKKNFEINNLKNTKIFQIFITNKDKNVFFNQDDDHPYNAIKNLESNSKLNKNNKIIQRALSITDFLDEINFYPDIILMDIEGFEVDVIEDLFLNKKLSIRPEILFEIHDQIYKQPKDLLYLKNILEENNYRCIQIGSNIYSYQNN